MDDSKTDPFVGLYKQANIRDDTLVDMGAWARDDEVHATVVVGVSHPLPRRKSMLN